MRKIVLAVVFESNLLFALLVTPLVMGIVLALRAYNRGFGS